MLLLWLYYGVLIKTSIFPLNVCYHDFMHCAIVSTCLCTNPILLSIAKVIHRWRWFWERSLDYRIFQARFKYVLIWLEGITIIEYLLFMHCNRLSNTIFRLYDPCAKYILCLWFNDMIHSISNGFYMKEILKEYSHIMKSFNFALLLIYVYGMNDTKHLAQDLW